MSDIEGLKDRVEQAVDQLSSVQNARQDQNQNLTNLLENIEEKFQARSVELEYCNSQIEALVQDNAQLSELLERLVNLIESDPSRAEDDPLTRASAMATALLDGWSGDKGAVEAVVEVPEEVSDFPEPQELVSEDSLSMSFDDVSDEELDAEVSDTQDVEVPELVAEAIAAAQETDEEFVGEEVQAEIAVEEIEEVAQAEIVEDVIAEQIVEDELMDEPVVVDLDIPENDEIFEDVADDILAGEIEEDTEASIRAMMARLEAAALDAKFSSEADSDEDSIDVEQSEQVA